MVLFRVLSAQPQTDGEHWKITGRWMQDAWHEDAYGQNPAPFQRNPKLSARLGPPYPWRPAYELGSSGDALFDGRQSFGVAIDTSSYPAQLTILGAIPVNVPVSSEAPQVPLQATTSNTGGGILPGSYLLCLTLDSLKGPQSQFVTAVVPAGTSTNTIVISGIVWPDDGTHHTSANLFVGGSSTTMISAGTTGGGPSLWTGSSPDGNGNPTVITLTTVPIAGAGLPDFNFKSFAVSATPIEHGGIWGDVVSSVSGAVLTFPAASWTVNQWAGRTLSLYYRPLAGDIAQPILNLAVVSNTSNELTMDTSSSFSFEAGDVVVMRTQGAHITANTIGDDGFTNSYAPSGLDVSGLEAGRQVCIVYGTGAGQPPKTVLSNTADILTISGTWDVTPDSTSVFIVTSATPVTVTTQSVTNDGSGLLSPVVAVVPAVTTEFQSLLIQAATSDDQGNYYPMRMQPFREVYIPPQNVAGGGPIYAVPNVGNTFTPDLNQGLNQKVVLVADSTINAPINGAAGMTWTLIIDQDSTGGHNAILDPAYFCNANLLGTATLSTRGQSNWIIDQLSPIHNSLNGTPSTDQPIPA